MDRYIVKNQKKLRCGITTGSCAAAAALAAATELMLGKIEDRVIIHTPQDIRLDIPVERVAGARFKVIKDSGDDPDVTDGTDIIVDIRELADGETVSEHAFYDERYGEIYLDGGEGVGWITKPGLEQGIGQAAINAVPRQMIFEAVHSVKALADYRQRVLVTVCVPAGKELAKKTFNPRLGIENGISILGTSGIIEPMSEAAIVETIRLEVAACHTRGIKNLLVMPGNYGKAYASDYLGLPLDDSIKCSNFIGETIDFAVAYGMESILIVGNIGKLSKLAAGVMNTHSRVADCRQEIFASHAAYHGAGNDVIKRLMSAINTDEMLTIIDEKTELRDRVIDSICDRIDYHISCRVQDNIKYGVILFSEKYGYLGQTKGAKELLDGYGTFCGSGSGCNGSDNT